MKNYSFKPGDNIVCTTCIYTGTRFESQTLGLTGKVGPRGLYFVSPKEWSNGPYLDVVWNVNDPKWKRLGTYAPHNGGWLPENFSPLIQEVDQTYAKLFI